MAKGVHTAGPRGPRPNLVQALCVSSVVCEWVRVPKCVALSAKTDFGQSERAYGRSPSQT